MCLPRTMASPLLQTKKDKCSKTFNIKESDEYSKKGKMNIAFFQKTLAVFVKLKHIWVLGDNLNDLDNGIQDKDGGKGLEWVGGVVDAAAMKTLPWALAELAVDPSKRTLCGLPRISSRTHGKMNTDFVEVEFY